MILRIIGYMLKGPPDDREEASTLWTKASTALNNSSRCLLQHAEGVSTLTVRDVPNRSRTLPTTPSRVRDVRSTSPEAQALIREEPNPLPESNRMLDTIPWMEPQSLQRTSNTCTRSPLPMTPAQSPTRYETRVVSSPYQHGDLQTSSSTGGLPSPHTSNSPTNDHPYPATGYRSNIPTGSTLTGNHLHPGGSWPDIDPVATPAIGNSTIVDSATESPVASTKTGRLRENQALPVLSVGKAREWRDGRRDKRGKPPVPGDHLRLRLNARDHVSSPTHDLQVYSCFAGVHSQ